MDNQDWKLYYDDHPACPKCGSSDTELVQDESKCICGCKKFPHPVCKNKECDNVGYATPLDPYWINLELLNLEES